MAEADRRRDPRAKVRLVVRYRCLDESHVLWHEGTILDISAGGIRLSCERPLEQGSRIEVDVQLPARDERLILQGDVQWTAHRPSGSEGGVMFVDVSSERQFDLDTLVHFLTQKRSPSS